MPNHSPKAKLFFTVCSFGFLILVTFGLVGCGNQISKELEPNPLRGKLLFADGSPAHKARITFHPVTHKGKVDNFTTKVEETGVFTLVPGLPAGEYQLSVVLMKKDKSTGDQKNTLPAKYQDPATSGIVIQIVSGTNELGSISISKH